MLVIASTVSRYRVGGGAVLDDNRSCLELQCPTEELGTSEAAAVVLAAGGTA